MVAKKEIKPRVAKRVLMYRARKELPVRTDRGRIQKGEMVTVEKAEAIATALGVRLEEIFAKYVGQSELRHDFTGTPTED